MPTASATSPIMPPSASTSRTRWPLATPPTAGLQLIWAMRSRFMVISAVLRPMRAAAIAASQPACPAPTTTTSYCSVKAICLYCTDALDWMDHGERDGPVLRQPDQHSHETVNGASRILLTVL